jgi:UDP:flavonoid glycosyltransferase YjiC (YdhE family)
MKQRVIFLFYHGLGHVNSFLKAARILEENHYEVWFAGSGFFQQYVTLQGCKFYLLKSYPFGTGLEKWINTIEGKNKIYFRTLWDRITDRVFTERQVELFWMLEELKPTVVFIDKMLSTDFIVLYANLKNRGIKVAMINTMLPTQVIGGRPPLNSDVLPADSQTVLKAVNKMNWDKLKKKWKQKSMMLGFDDTFMINRRIKKNAIPRRYISVNADLLKFTTIYVDEYILAPREFDFPQSMHQSNQVYVGFMTTSARVEIVGKAYENFAASIVAMKREKNLKLVYCSFGTVPAKQREATATFIQKLASIAAEGEFIIVVSGKFDEKIVSVPGTNFYTFETVPQLEILKNTDIFITHGGLNSIKEAVYAEIPMLIYPVHAEYDPRGNAARVFYHGLGLRGDIVSESVDDIKSKVRQLLSNKIYRENLRRLKNIDGLYTGKAFLDSMERIKPLE